MKKRSGQSIIIAILILGVLLTLGFVFAGLISRNIIQTGRSFKRNTASDLAESGVRFAHMQLTDSDVGADWRPARTLPAVVGGISRDPDALYMRQGTGFRMRRPDGSLSNVLDRGGPDGLGPFTRVDFDKGRALIRVLYLPSDFTLYGSPTGVLRQPGRARYYLRVESVGRPGRVDVNDPTTLASQGVQVAGFANDNLFNDSLGLLKNVDSRNVDQKKLIAFVSLGIIEHTRFVTNKFNVTRPAEFGSLTAANGPESDGLGITTEGVPVEVPTLLGGDLFDSAGTLLDRGTGSVYINSSLVVHGLIQTYLNTNLGDSISVAGDIKAANAASRVDLLRVDPTNPLNVTTTTLTGAALNSRTAGFSTQGGLFRDGVNDIDGAGYTRGVSRKEPPSFLTIDRQSGVNRYLSATRDSGVIINGRQSGRFGYGRGIYVDARDRANTANENEREAAGAAKSLPNDWLRPNNPTSIAWRGPYYIPIASYVQLLPDGFVLIRDSRAANAEQRFWRQPNGTVTGNSRIRFRIRTVTEPGGTRQAYSLNSIANPTLIDQSPAALADTDFLNSGQQFNGLLYFEGDVRVRGVIPTNQQLTLISMGSIYVEGSITKGTVDDNLNVLTTPSRSMLMLMAQDYCVVNTTMFVGPAPGETVRAKNVDAAPESPNPIELSLTAQDRIRLQLELLKNPNTATPPIGNPATWEPYSTSYVSDLVAGGSATLSPWLVLQHSADDNGPSLVRVGMTGQSFGDPAPNPTAYYLFNGTDPHQGTPGQNFNADLWNYLGTPTSAIYGLTRPARAAYPRFESIAFRLGDGADTISAGNRRVQSSAAMGGYEMAIDDSSYVDVELAEVGALATKNYALSRVGLNPHDVRIEASLFAENGSFFVIPGPDFNLNSEDTREKFDADVTASGFAAAQQIRFDDFGTMPAAPFYGEPLNTRVTIVGSITENMPVPIGQQAEWQKRWGWMPRTIGATGVHAPRMHVPANWGAITGATPARHYLPNLIVSYDPALAMGSADGSSPIRTTPDGLWILSPMPRLPVSPSLAYFGEENP